MLDICTIIYRHVLDNLFMSLPFLRVFKDQTMLNVDADKCHGLDYGALTAICTLVMPSLETFERTNYRTM